MSDDRSKARSSSDYDDGSGHDLEPLEALDLSQVDSGVATVVLEVIGPILLFWPFGSRRIRLVLIASFAALHIGIEQPFDDEESAFDASDFTQRQGKFMLTRIGRELFQQLAGRHNARCHCGYGAQNIRPVLNDQSFPDFATDQTAQFRGR